MDEIYDIFNRDGQKTGTATWTECHTKGLIHCCVSVLIFRDASHQETLLQKRSKTMAQHPGLWQHAAGGHVLAGDSTQTGVQKELQEELFFEHSLPENLHLKRLGTFFNQDMPNNNEFLTLFEVVYPGPFYYSPEEVEEPPVWVKWDDVLKDIQVRPQMYQPAFKNIIDAYTNPSRFLNAPQF